MVKVSLMQLVKFINVVRSPSIWDLFAFKRTLTYLFNDKEVRF